MRRSARASLAGRQHTCFTWFLTFALLWSAFASLVPSFSPPTGALAAERMIKLPFASGAEWTVSQGYNTGATGGSHYNCTTAGCYYKYKYSLDIVRSDGNTAGQTVLSPVNGTIRWIDPAYGGMSINLGNGWAVAYFHTVVRADLAMGDTVVQGEYMGTIAPPGQGGNGGFPHIHVTLWKTSDGGNWDRDAQPFTGAQSIDGYDLPAMADSVANQYRSRTLVSTNTQSGAGETIPSQVAKISPAHGESISSPTVSLSWSGIPNATSYQVVLDPGTAAEQFSIWLTGTTWTTPALPEGDHTWQVRARNSAGTGNWSSTWRFWVVKTVAGSVLDNGAMIATGTYQVFGTREGLVGGTTSSGHVIVENDHFVSLPACVAITCTWLTPGTTHPTWGYVTPCGSKCYVIVKNPKNNVCRVEPVWDRGPLFNVDDYWSPTDDRFVNGKIADKGLDYALAQGYTADSAAFAGFDVGWGTTVVNGVKRGNSNLKYSNGTPYVVQFRTSIDIGDGTWLELGFPWDPGPQTVVVTMLWQVGTSVADAEAACEGPKAPPPYFTMSKSSGTPDTVIAVNGKYYGKNETVKVYLDSSKTTPLASATTDSDGRFSTSFTVPDTLGGPHRIHVVGQTSKLRTGKNFSIKPLASVNKPSGSANLGITMTGTNFAAGEIVDVVWDGSASVSGTGTADSSGTVKIPVRAPTVNGAHSARLKGRTNLLSAYTSYTVVQRVRVSPSSGPAGTKVTVSGTGWPANKTISFRWATKTGTVRCSAISNAAGSVQCTFMAPSGYAAGEYRVWGTDGTRYASAVYTLTGATLAEQPSETPAETATPSETPVDATPIADETPVDQPTAPPTEEPTVPTETPTAAPTEVPTSAPRTSDGMAVADTSVTLATPEAPQPVESVGVLTSGGPDSAVTYISFAVGDIGAGTVTEAHLVVTGTDGGGPGGTVGVISGYVVDEAGTGNSLPTQNINAAVTRDGGASTIGTVAPGEVTWIDVTGSIQADGQYTFVITGDAAQVLALSSREGASPPRLVLTIQD